MSEEEKIEPGLLFIDELIDLLLLNEIDKIEGKAKDRSDKEYAIEAFWDDKNQQWTIHLSD